MQFCLDDDQLALQEAVARLLRDECRAANLPRRSVEGDPQASAGLREALFALGIGGLLVPEADGGIGLGLIEAALVAQALGYEAAPVEFIGHSLACQAIALAGTPQQRQNYLPRLASGEIRATFAFGEAGEIWAPDHWRLAPEHGRLSGTKHFVFGADKADLFVVGLAGGALALVPRDAAAITPQRGLDGTRPLFTVRFDQAAPEPLAQPAAAEIFDALLVLLAADAQGCARRCIDMTVDYAKTRQQFGRLIGSFQAFKHQLANITADLVPTEPMVWYGAIGKSMGLGALAAAQTKAHVTERAVEAARLAVELHGGIGYTWDCDLQIWLKRAMCDFSYAGTPMLHRARSMTLAEQQGGGGALSELL